MQFREGGGGRYAYIYIGLCSETPYRKRPGRLCPPILRDSRRTMPRLYLGLHFNDFENLLFFLKSGFYVRIKSQNLKGKRTSINVYGPQLQAP